MPDPTDRPEYPGIHDARVRMAHSAREFAEKTGPIHATRDLTPEAKARRIGELYSEAKERYIAAAEDLKRERNLERARLHRRAFVPGTSYNASKAEQATIAATWANALTAARAAADGNKLSGYIDAAVASQDVLSQQAALAIAHERGAFDVLERYVANDGPRSGAVGELLEFERAEGSLRSAQERFAERFEYAPPRLPAGYAMTGAGVVPDSNR